jgi:hypothetical protein
MLKNQPQLFAFAVRVVDQVERRVLSVRLRMIQSQWLSVSLSVIEQSCPGWFLRAADL